MKALRVLALAAGSWCSTSSVYGLWDLARQDIACKAGLACGYPMPFAIFVPWYIAGDIFVTLAFAGMAAFILGATGLITEKGSGMAYPQFYANTVGNAFQAVRAEDQGSTRDASLARHTHSGLTA